MSRPLITVKSLLAAARTDGPIPVAADALITPAAADWLRTSGRVTETVAPSPPSASPALHLVGDAAAPFCQALLPLLERALGRVVFRPCRGQRSGLLQALRETGVELAADGRARGVVVVHAGGMAACVANKLPGVRAAVVERPAQLAANLHDFAMNLLILEPPRVALRQALGLIEAFVRTRPEMDPALAAVLAGEAPPAEGSCGCRHARG